MEENMSETTSTESAPVENGAEVQQEQATTEPAETLGEGGLKALQAEREAAKTARAEVAQLKAELQKIEDAKLSDLDRASKERDEYRTQLEELQAQALRSQVALAKGVPAELVEFLTAKDEDALAAQADKLLAKLAPQSPATPRPDPTQGASGQSGPKNNADLFASFLTNKIG